MRTQNLFQNIGLAFMASGLLSLTAPASAQAQAQAQVVYDGYCYQKKSEAKTSGAVVGAVAGAVIGSEVAGRGDRTAGAAAGAAAGAVLGAEAGAGSVNCSGGHYYVYTEGYVPPPPPPPGYTVVYYTARPVGVVYQPVFVTPRPVYRPVYIAPVGPGYRASYRKGYYDGRHPMHAY